jgi:threonine dehydrogenase-like Zn-dependent dehydrogenase
MRGAVLYAPGDVCFEERDAPKITEPTDAIIRMSATCVCGSHLWPYRGINAVTEPTPMGHEYCGIVEEVGRAVTSVKSGQFVIAGGPAARATRGRHCGGHPGGSHECSGPEPPHALGRHGNGLVRGGRGEREAGHDRRSRRRRRGASSVCSRRSRWAPSGSSR